MSAVTLPTSITIRALPPLKLLNPSNFCPLSSISQVSVNNVSKAVGRLRSSSFRVHDTTVYKVKFIGPDGVETEFDAPSDVYLLDSAENVGLELPYSCRAGACCSCTAQIVSGSVDQSEGSFLGDDLVGKGFILPCVSYPTSDCVVYTHKEGDLY